MKPRPSSNQIAFYNEQPFIDDAILGFEMQVIRNYETRVAKRYAVYYHLQNEILYQRLNIYIDLFDDGIPRTGQGPDFNAPGSENISPFQSETAFIHNLILQLGFDTICLAIGGPHELDNHKPPAPTIIISEITDPKLLDYAMSFCKVLAECLPK